jgi:hypothetical protein
MITFIPFSLIAAGFFAAPMTFLFLLLPIGGLYYYILAFIVAPFSSALGPDFAGFGSGFMILLAGTGVGYLYVLSSYIAYVSKRKQDTKRVLMMASLAGIFVSPVLILIFPVVLYSSTNQYATPASTLGEETCQDLPVKEGTGSASWSAESQECTVTGILVFPSDRILTIGNTTTLTISGNTSRLEYWGYYYLVNEGTLQLKDGATFIIPRDYQDPENPREGFLANRGLIVVDETSTLVNQGRLENVELAGKILNHGTLENRGELFSNNLIENRGMLTNYEYLWSYDTDLTVSEGKPVSIVNYGTINNLDKMENSGTFHNYGTVGNYHRLDAGTMHNHATIYNVGELVGIEIYNYCLAEITPDAPSIPVRSRC